MPGSYYKRYRGIGQRIPVSTVIANSHDCQRLYGNRCSTSIYVVSDPAVQPALKQSLYVTCSSALKASKKNPFIAIIKPLVVSGRPIQTSLNCLGILPIFPRLNSINLTYFCAAELWTHMHPQLCFGLPISNSDRPLAFARNLRGCSSTGTHNSGQLAPSDSASELEKPNHLPVQPQ